VIYKGDGGNKFKNRKRLTNSMLEETIGEARFSPGLARYIRRQKGYTQADVARESGVSQGYISRVENGTWEPSDSGGGIKYMVWLRDNGYDTYDKATTLRLDIAFIVLRAFDVGTPERRALIIKEVERATKGIN